MTTKNHTPIPYHAGATSSVVNNALGGLDASIGDRDTLETAAKESIVDAINELAAEKQDALPPQAANTVMAGPTSGENQPPVFRNLVSADIPPLANDKIAVGAGIAWGKISKTGALASEIGNTPAGGISSTTVQGALNELDTEKAPATHSHTRTSITDLTSQPLDTFAAPSDSTVANATTLRPGLFPKLHGSLERFLNGVGSWVRAVTNIKISGTDYSDVSRLTIQGSAVLSHSQITDTDGRQAVVLTLTGSGTGGGATALSALVDDVLIDSLVDGHLLRYVGAAGKWQNVPVSNIVTPGHTIQGDGVNLTNFSTLNFTDGLTASVDGATIKISGPAVKLDGTALAAKKSINFTGALSAAVNGSDIDVSGPVLQSNGTPLAAQKAINFLPGLSASVSGGAVNIGVSPAGITLAQLADDEYSGITEAGVAAVAVTKGQFIILGSTGKWGLANASAAATASGKAAICLTNASADAAILVLLIGKIRLDAIFPAMTPGGAVYFSAATAGALVQEQPTGSGEVVRLAGYANASKELWFNPSVPIELK